MMELNDLQKKQQDDLNRILADCYAWVAHEPGLFRADTDFRWPDGETVKVFAENRDGGGVYRIFDQGITSVKFVERNGTDANPVQIYKRAAEWDVTVTGQMHLQTEMDIYGYDMDKDVARLITACLWCVA